MRAECQHTTGAFDRLRTRSKQPLESLGLARDRGRVRQRRLGVRRHHSAPFRCPLPHSTADTYRQSLFDSSGTFTVNLNMNAACAGPPLCSLAASTARHSFGREWLRNVHFLLKQQFP